MVGDGGAEWSSHSMTTTHNSLLEVVLVIDSRENVHYRERLKKYCTSRKIPYEERELPAGDYLFIQRTIHSSASSSRSENEDELVLPFIIERKSWSDLADSVKGKGRRRLDCVKQGMSSLSSSSSSAMPSCCQSTNCQLYKMKRCGCTQLLFIIEGPRCNGSRDERNCNDKKRCQACKALGVRHGGLTQEDLECDSLHRLQLDHGCFIHYTRSYNETITTLGLIYQLLLGSNSGGSPCSNITRNGSTCERKGSSDDIFASVMMKTRMVGTSESRRTETARSLSGCDLTYEKFCRNIRIGSRKKRNTNDDNNTNADSTGMPFSMHHHCQRKNGQIVEMTVEQMADIVCNNKDWKSNLIRELIGDNGDSGIDTYLIDDDDDDRQRHRPPSPVTRNNNAKMRQQSRKVKKRQRQDDEVIILSDDSSTKSCCVLDDDSDHHEIVDTTTASSSTKVNMEAKSSSRRRRQQQQQKQQQQQHQQNTKEVQLIDSDQEIFVIDNIKKSDFVIGQTRRQEHDNQQHQEHQMVQPHSPIDIIELNESQDAIEIVDVDIVESIPRIRGGGWWQNGENNSNTTSAEGSFLQSATKKIATTCPFLIIHGWETYDYNYYSKINQVWQSVYKKRRQQMSMSAVPDTEEIANHTNNTNDVPPTATADDIFTDGVEGLSELVSANGLGFPFISRETLLFVTLFLQVRMGVMVRMATRKHYANEMKCRWTDRRKNNCDITKRFPSQELEVAVATGYLNAPTRETGLPHHSSPATKLDPRRNGLAHKSATDVIRDHGRKTPRKKIKDTPYCAIERRTPTNPIEDLNSPTRETGLPHHSSPATKLDPQRNALAHYSTTNTTSDQGKRSPKKKNKGIPCRVTNRHTPTNPIGDLNPFTQETGLPHQLSPATKLDPQKIALAHTFTTNIKIDQGKRPPRKKNKGTPCRVTDRHTPTNPQNQKVIEARLRRFGKDNNIQPNYDHDLPCPKKRRILDVPFVQRENNQLWTCENCTFNNSIDDEQCCVCLNERNPIDGNKKDLHSIHNGQCNQMEIKDVPSIYDSHSTNSSYNMKKESPLWNCERCTFINNVHVPKCAACSKPNQYFKIDDSNYIQFNGNIEPKDIDVTTSSTSYICNDNPQIYIKRHSSKLLDNTNTSLPSSFSREIPLPMHSTSSANPISTPSKGVKCGACQEYGHNRRIANEHNCSAYWNEDEVKRRQKKERENVEKAEKAKEDLRRMEGEEGIEKRQREEMQAMMRQCLEGQERNVEYRKAEIKRKEKELRKAQREAERYR